MTSLMQGFAKDRQTRQQARVKALEELTIWRQQRSLEFKRQVTATHVMLAEQTKQRLVSEQVRLTLAEADRLRRIQVVAARKSSVNLELQQIATTRLANARLQLTQRYIAEQKRIEIAENARALRIQELETLKVETQEFLETAKSDRLEMATNLKQRLSDYVNYIHLSVWGMDYSDLVEESRTESQVIAYPAPIPAGIEEFIADYVSSLQGSPSLVQVVNDRDRVKDLLTTGATTLKVDPSEILNSLIKMVDLDNEN